MADQPPRRTDPSRPATIYDVAEHAGLSHQTVSRFLRGYDGIRPQTRARVLDSIEQLGFKPNATARALRAGRSNRIAALTHEVAQIGPSAIIRGATAAAQQAGFVLDVISLNAESVAAVNDALVALQHQNLDGIIALASTDEMARALDSVAFAKNIVRAGEVDTHLTSPQEGDEGEMVEVARHLHDLGHRHLLHIAGPSNWAAARNRSRSLARTARGLSMPEPRVVHGDWSAASGYRALREVSLAGVTAIVAANDQMALGAMLALHDRGIRVPDQISVTGVDDIAESEFFLPPLTTLPIDFELRGQLAIREVLIRIGVDTEPVTASGSPGLKIRRSTGPASA